MGRGRSGGVVSSRKKSAQCKNPVFFTQNGPYIRKWKFAREQIEVLQHIPNEQLAAAILSPAARPSTPREQTPASGHRAGSTPRENQASLQSSES